MDSLKPILRRGKVSDIFSNCLYGVSPYMACSHGCLYCDGRAEKYHVSGDFSTDVTIRSNVPSRLAADLQREREIDRQGRRCLLGLSSGISDVYQELEKDHGLSKACLELALHGGFPVLTMTKSTLWLRDIEIWDALSHGPGAVLYLSLNTLDDKVRRHFEPGAPAVEARLEAMAELDRRGIPFGILAMPLLPGLGDGTKESTALIDTLAQYRPAFIMPGGLTLRPGRQKNCFLAGLGDFDGGRKMLGLYADVYGEERPSGMPRKDWYEPRTEQWHKALASKKIPAMMPHRILKSMLPSWESLHILLQHMTMLYQSRGHNTERLTRASGNYKNWLIEQRSSFRRQRSLDNHWINQQFDNLFQGEGLFEDSGTLESVLGNQRLAELIRKLYDPQAEQDCYFDYTTLSVIERSL